MMIIAHLDWLVYPLSIAATGLALWGLSKILT